MKKENKNNYYNDEDKINFEKLNNFKKFKSDNVKNFQIKNYSTSYSNSDKNNFNNILKTNENIATLNQKDISEEVKYYNSSDFKKFDQHPKVLILNDPARGIDVSTKRDLYTHLRNYVEEGNTVVFLSSELEEFIGLCPKVMVFRNGTVFDIFENEKVNADTLLEGMFGQTAGIGETTISSKSNAPLIPTPNKKIDNKIPENKILKVVDFDKENNNENKTKIKIKTF